MDKEFKLDGGEEIMDALSGLPVEMQAKILKAYISKAGRQYIVNPLKTKLNYSKDTESSIKILSNPGNKLSVFAGVSTKGYKLNWADRGTKIRTTKKGYNRGRIIGKNQVQPHIENSVKPIVDYTNKELGNEINKYLERRLKKFKK